MSQPRYLIDTNVFIGLEDTREVNTDFAALLQLAAKHSIGIFIHEAARDDIARDKDAARRAVSLSKLAKFQIVSRVRDLKPTDLEASFGPLQKANDVVDATLLHALSLGVVDFLVTEDAGLHARARRYAAELANRVLFVADATSLLRTTYEPIDVPIRFVEELDANTIPLADAIFDSLREGYQGFDEWWRQKCVREQRKCWVVFEEGEISGIVVRKEEGPNDTDASLPGRKFLKVCTFKVRPQSRGVKLGELLLKQALWFAQKNDFDVVYLTAFPEQSALIALLEYYGFCHTATANTGEFTYEKSLSREPLPAKSGDNLFDLARLSYPRFHAGTTAEAYGVPIKEVYHDALFPELVDDTQPDLFGFGGTAAIPRRPGNTIRKVYLCRAPKWIHQPGAILVFYKGKAARSPSQAMTVVGIFEDMSLAHSTDDLRRLAGGRSVYSARQLQEWEASAARPVKVINFLLAGFIVPSLKLPELHSEGIFSGHPPQSIFTLNRAKLLAILERFDGGFQPV